MDIAEIQAALRIPEQRSTCTTLDDALHRYEAAVHRVAVAEAEASLARRPSTLRATLKATTALDRARVALLSELRALARVPVAEAAAPVCG